MRYVVLEILIRLASKGRIQDETLTNSLKSYVANLVTDRFNTYSSVVASMANEDPDPDVRSCASFFINKLEVNENTEPGSLQNNKLIDGFESLLQTKA